MRNEHLYSLQALPCSLFPPVSAERSRCRDSPHGSLVTAGSGAAPGLSITRQSTFSAHLTCQLGDGALLFTLFTFYRQSCDPGLLFKAYPSCTSPPLSAEPRGAWAGVTAQPQRGRDGGCGPGAAASRPHAGCPRSPAGPNTPPHPALQNPGEQTERGAADASARDSKRTRCQCVPS